MRFGVGGDRSGAAARSFSHMGPIMILDLQGARQATPLRSGIVQPPRARTTNDGASALRPIDDGFVKRGALFV